MPGIAVIYQEPTLFPDLSVAGAALSSGQITGAQGEKFKAGKVGEYSIGADGEIVLGPPTEFTAANIDQFNF